MTRTSLISALMVATTAGVAIGVAAVRLGSSPPLASVRVHQSLDRELGLSPVQTERIKAIILRRQPEVDRIWERASAAMDSVFALVSAEISAELRPDQIPLLERYLQQVRARYTGKPRT